MRKTTYIFIALLLIGVLLLITVGVYEKLPGEYRTSLDKKFPRIELWIFLVSIVLIVGSGYIKLSQLIKKEKYGIFVSPRKWTVGAGQCDKFSMKVTNNKNVPLYEIHVLIQVESGDIPTNNIKIEPSSQSTLDVSIPANGNSIHWKPDYVVFFGRTNKKKEDSNDIAELIINNINAHSAQAFVLDIDAINCKKRSKISFNVSRHSENPPKITRSPPAREKNILKLILSTEMPFYLIL